MATEKWLIDNEKTIDFELVRHLKVSLIGGQVDIVAHDEPGARVEIHDVRGKPISVTFEGDTLEVDHPQLRWDNFLDVFKGFTSSAKARVSILVPRDVSLKFGVVSADGLISGLTEDATISTVSGDIVVDRVYGDLELNSVSGEIAVRDHYGNVTAKSVSGNLTVSGEVLRLTSNAVSGDAFLDLRGIPDEVRVKTVSGDVTVRLESHVPAQYKVNTVSGKLQLDNTEITGVRGSYSGKYGDLHQRWLEFFCTTVSGDIVVMHAAAASAPAAAQGGAA